MRNPLLKSKTKAFNFQKPGIILVFLALSLICPLLLKAQSAFTFGNLVVEQVGTGTSTLSSAASPINFVEFSPTTGTVAQSVSASTTTFSESGSAGTAGCLTLSADGTTLVFVAYNEAANGAASVTSSTVNREVGFVSQGSSPTPTVATYFTNSGASSDAYTANNIKAAYFDGTTIWSTGNEASTACSIRASTVTSGGAASPNTQLSSVPALTASCGIGVFKDQLYFTQSGSTGGTFQLGTGKPTTSGQTATAVGGTYAVLNAVYLNVTNANPGHPDVMYTADNGKTGLLHKYYWNTGTSTWTLAGTTLISSTTAAGTGGYLTAGMNSLGNIDLYVVIGEGNKTSNYVIKCTDVGPLTAVSLSASPTTVLSSGADYEFTGISWAPSQTSAIAASNYATTISSSGNIAAGNYGDLTIPSGVTATLTGNIYINGTLTVQSGGTLKCGNYFVFSPPGSYGTFNLQSGGTLEVADDSGINKYSATGNIQTFSRFYSTGAHYIYNSTVAQATGDGLPATALDLILNNSKGLTLTSPVSITDSLTLTSGSITLGNNKLSIAASGVIVGATASDYILTNGTGTLEMTVGTSGASFPIGGTDYNPVKVATTSSTATFDVLVNSAITNSSNVAGTDHSVKRTWSVTAPSGTTAIVTPQWDDSKDLTGSHFLDAYSFVASRTNSYATWVQSQAASADNSVSGTLYDKSSGNITMSSATAYQIGVFDSASAYNAVDAGVYKVLAPVATACAGAQPVKVLLRNYGSTSLTSVNIGWTVNRVAQTPYSWTGTLANAATLSVSIGSYTFTAGKDTIKAWTYSPNGKTDSVNINDTARLNMAVNALPAASVASPSTVCAGTAVSIGATAVSGSSYAWTSTISGYSSTVSNPSVSPTTTATYTVTETNSSGCSNSNSVTITTKPLPAAAAGSPSTICVGAPAFTIGAAAVTGSTYSWASTVSGFSSTISNPSVQPASTATYTVTETGTNGCSNSNSVTITVVSLPAASVVSSTAICAGSSISIGATAVSGSSYSWTSTISGYSSTVSNPSVSPASTSTYTLTETNAGGCSKSNSVTITVNPVPVAAAGSPSTICSGAPAFTIGAAAVTGSTYSWASTISGFSSTVSNPFVSPTTTATYTVTETNSSGCSKSNTVTITVNPLPAASVISNTAICAGNSISIGGTTVTGSSYSWVSTISGFSSTVSNPSVTPTSTSTYTLTETNSNGCVKSNMVTITVNALPVAAVASASTVCGGTAVSIGAASVTGSTYFWTSTISGFSSTVSNPSVSPSSTATSTITETNSSGCAKSNSVTITVNPAPAAAVSSNQAVCPGTSVSLGATAVSGDTYSWASSLGGFSSTSSNPTITPTSTATYTLTETITATGCQKSDTIKVFVNPAPSAITGSNETICAGYSIKIGSTPVLGNSYSWTSSSGFTSTISNPTITPASTATYTLTESVSGSCTTTHSVTITVNPLPAANAGSNSAVCAGSAATIGTTAVTGDNYSWTSNPSGYTSTASTASVAPTGTTTYILMESNPVTSCSNTNLVVVTVNPLPAANAGTNASICKGSSITIGSTSAASRTYSWVSSPSGFTSTVSNPTVSPASTTAYTFTEKSTATGCSNSNSVTITVNPLPVAATGPATTLCAGNSVTIGATAVTGDTYSWTSVPSGYASTSANPSVTPASTTTYAVVETVTATGCTNTNSVLVTVNALPAANAGSSSTICAGQSATIGAAAVTGSSYSWASNPTGFSSSTANNTVSPTATTIYTLTETSASGCVKLNTTTVTVNTLPTANISTGSPVICAGSSASISNSSPATGNLYQWYQNGNAITGAANSGYSATSGGNYYELVTSSGGCSAKSNVVTVKVNPLPTAIVKTSKTATICQGDSLSLVATLDSNDTYQWSNLAAAPSLISGATSYKYKAIAAGTYQVRITSLAGCTDTATSVKVTVNPLPTSSIGASGATTFCSGGSVTLATASTSGVNYAWYNNGTPVSGATTNSYTAIASGSYSLNAVNVASGCSSVSSSIPVIVNSLPVVNVTALGSTSFCDGGNVILVTDYDPTYSYKWSNTGSVLTGETKDTITAKQSGSYNVTTTNGSGCSVTSTAITVTVSALPTVKITRPSNTSFCEGSILSIGAVGTSVKTYQWTLNDVAISGANTDSLKISQTGNYEIVATSTSGCMADDTIGITVNATPVAGFISATNTICAGGAIAFANQSYISSGTTLSYNWTFGDGSNSTSTNIDHPYTSAGTYNVQLTATSTKGCTSVAKDVVTVLPVTSSAFTTSALGYERIVFEASDKTGSTYNWNFGDSTTGTSKAEFHQYPASGNYTVTLTVTNANGCSSTTTSTVTVNSSGIDPVTTEDISIKVFPNPFETQTNVIYTLNQSASVAIEVFDIDGKRVAFVDNTRQVAGAHNYIFNGPKPGIYFIKMMVDDKLYVNKVVQQ